MMNNKNNHVYIYLLYTRDYENKKNYKKNKKNNKKNNKKEKYTKIYPNK